MLDAICNPDEELLVVLALSFFGALIYKFFSAYNSVILAEKYLDPNHWAGTHSKYGPSRFFCECVRANTGLGYAPEGRRIWWQGHRWFFVCWGVGVILVFGVPLAEHYCS